MSQGVSCLQGAMASLCCKEVGTMAWGAQRGENFVTRVALEACIYR